MLHLAKNVTFFRYFRFPSFSIVHVRRNQQGNLVFITTKVEDTHLTLAVIPVKVEANNSLIFLRLREYGKKFAEYSFLFSL